MKEIDDRIQEVADNKQVAIQQAKARAPERVTAYNLNDWQIFQLIVELCEAIPPHPSQLLWCDGNITKTTLKNFVQRAKQFPHLPYVIVGVNLLQLSVREQLLNILSNIFVAQEQKTYGPMSLVFTEAIGVEVFTFLKDQQKNEGNIQNLKGNTYFDTNLLLKNRSIKRFECINGDPCSGKSHYIKRQLHDLKVTFLLKILSLKQKLEE